MELLRNWSWYLITPYGRFKLAQYPEAAIKYAKYLDDVTYILPDNTIIIAEEP